jgi:hypothetical protein
MRLMSARGHFRPIQPVSPDGSCQLRSEGGRWPAFMSTRPKQLLFEKKFGEEQRKRRLQRLEHAPPIGFLPDGTLNVVRPEDLERSRNWKPKIIPDPEDESGHVVRRFACQLWARRRHLG